MPIRSLRYLLIVILFVGVSVLADAMVLAQDDDSWTRHSGSAVSMSAPPEWFNLSQSQQLTGGLSILGATNPTFNSYLQSLNNLELFLFESGSEASINVIAVPVSDLPPLDELLPMLQPGYDRAGLAITGMQVLSLPAGRAGRFRLSPTTNDANGNALTTAQFQYLIPAGNLLYFVTFSTTPERFEDLAPIFETIADTIEISGGTGGWQRYSGTDISLRVPTDWRSRAPGENTQIAVGLADETASVDVTVTTLEIPPAITDILSQLESAYDAQGREVVSLERVTLPAGIFVRGEVLIDGETRQVQYAGVIDGHYVTATFTLDDAQSERYLPVVARIMHTLRVV